MGWLGSSKSRVQETAQQSTTPVLPEWVQAAVTRGIQAGENAYQRPFQAYTGQLIAGLDPLQEQARTLATTSAGGWMPALNRAGQIAEGVATGGARDVMGPRVRAFTATPAQAVFNPSDRATAARAAPVAAIAAPGAFGGERVAPSTIASGMGQYKNPFEQQVTDNALRAIRRQTDMAQAGLGQRAASVGAFGGSREAIMRAEIERAAQEQSGDLAARLGREGFDVAGRFADADAGRAMQAGLFNADQARDAFESAATRQQQANLFNAGQAQDTGLRNAQFEQQAGLFNAEQEARYGLSNADRAQQANLFNAGQAQEAGAQSAEMRLRAQIANQDSDNTALSRRLQAAGLFGDLGRVRAGLSRDDVAVLDTLGASGRDVTQEGLAAARGEFLREQEYADDRTRMLLASIYGAPLSMFRGENTTGSGTRSTRNFSTTSALSDLGRLFSAGRSIFG